MASLNGHGFSASIPENPPYCAGGFFFLFFREGVFPVFVRLDVAEQHDE